MGEIAGEQASARRLNESSLWREDALTLDHSSVWGSWFDAGNSRWGYACCQSTIRAGPCSSAKARAGEVSSADEMSSDSEGRSQRLAQMASDQPFDWSNPPTELQQREDVEDPSAFVDHFVRFCLEAWRRKQASGLEGFSELERAAFQDGDSLRQAVEALVPLLRQLKEGRVDSSVLKMLDKMGSLASAREYLDADKVYMELTLGNKKWHSTCVMHIPACQMKGAREYRRNRDDLNIYDQDPVAQKYIHGMRKVIQFAQCIRPNVDQSKNKWL
uniref:Prp18 domain-containing protein n=1 Tax=Noctiluca scintillans TaxID=2966 RepID=A0A7S1B0A1_NOCSC